MFIVLLSSNATSEENEDIKFSFAPGDKTSFIQKLTTTKEKDMAEKGRQLDESISTTKITMTKTKNGWDLLAEPQSISMMRNGQKIDNPILSLLSSAVIKYKLDSDGNIIDVEGYEAFIDGISKQVPPQVFQQLSPVLNVEAMKAKEVAEWNGRIGDYIGAEVEIGDSFAATVPFQLPNGSTINYNVKTNISGVEPCSENKCVRIDQVYDSKADSVAKMSGEMVSNVTKVLAPEIEKSNQENNTASINGSVKRLIDPSTMLIYTEESVRVISMNMNIPGAGSIPMKMTETRQYEFLY